MDNGAWKIKDGGSSSSIVNGQWSMVTVADCPELSSFKVGQLDKQLLTSAGGVKKSSSATGHSLLRGPHPVKLAST